MSAEPVARDNVKAAVRTSDPVALCQKTQQRERSWVAFLERQHLHLDVLASERPRLEQRYAAGGQLTQLHGLV